MLRRTGGSLRKISYVMNFECRKLQVRAVSTGQAKGTVLDGSLPPPSEFIANKEQMDRYQKEFTDLAHKVQLGGGERAQKRHKERNKLLARERIDR